MDKLMAICPVLSGAGTSVPQPLRSPLLSYQDTEDTEAQRLINLQVLSMWQHLAEEFYLGSILQGCTTGWLQDWESFRQNQA